MIFCASFMTLSVPTKWISLFRLKMNIWWNYIFNLINVLNCEPDILDSSKERWTFSFNAWKISDNFHTCFNHFHSKPQLVWGKCVRGIINVNSKYFYLWIWVIWWDVSSSALCLLRLNQHCRSQWVPVVVRSKPRKSTVSLIKLSLHSSFCPNKFIFFTSAIFS